MLVLVGESSELDTFVAATGASDDQILRAPLTSDQARELDEASRG